jgi:hypothetical protein
LIHVEHFHLFFQEPPKGWDGNAFVLRILGTAPGIDCLAKEIGNGDAWYGHRVLESQEKPGARAASAHLVPFQTGHGLQR